MTNREAEATLRDMAYVSIKLNPKYAEMLLMGADALREKQEREKEVK